MIGSENKPALLTLCGIIILILGIFMFFYGFPKILDMKIKEGISLEEKGEGYQMWQEFPIPLKFKVYIFNVENPSEVQQGANPIVREVGPYIYDQYRKKEKIKISDQNDTINYILRKTFFFNKEESGCHTPEDEVTVLNAALVGTALTVQTMFPSALSTISEAVPFLFPGIKDVFIKVKVKDLLFNGILLDCSAPDVEFVCTAIKGVAPDTIRQHENKRDFLFSLFHHLNDTEEGPYTMGRGIKDTKRGELYSYENEPNLGDMWFDSKCNMLNGTDSTIYATMEDGPAPRIFAFSSDLCRSVYLEFHKKTETFGLPTYRYRITEKAFDIMDENDCYCPRSKDESYKTFIDCPPKGTMNLMPCMQAPSIFSHPHFYLGDRSLVKFVTGVNPDKKKHEMFAEIEPLTGTPIKGWKKAQMNLFLKKLEDFELLNNVSEGLLPLIWLEEGAELPDFLLDKIRVAYTGICIVDIVKWVIIAVGLLLLATVAIMLSHRDKLWCFAETHVAHFSENGRPRPDNNNPMTIRT